MKGSKLLPIIAFRHFSVMLLTTIVLPHLTLWLSRRQLPGFWCEKGECRSLQLPGIVDWLGKDAWLILKLVTVTPISIHDRIGRSKLFRLSSFNCLFPLTVSRSRSHQTREKRLRLGCVNLPLLLKSARIRYHTTYPPQSFNIMSVYQGGAIRPKKL